VPHPIILVLCPDLGSVGAAAKAVHALGIQAADLSVVARSHEAAGLIAADVDATPGVEIEDSRAAARLGELGGLILAALASILVPLAPLVLIGVIVWALVKALARPRAALVR
jgi:hypothetical protein